MSRKMLINALHPEEARVAIVEDGRLTELDIEIAGSEQTRGNVYKGVVVRVEPGLQAAFVDIGLKKLGFLQMGELHPTFWQWRDDIPEDQRKRRPRIQEVLRRGQELIVQVEKGERDMKGAALTTYMSFPGRYMVIMPGSDSAGVSRKVEGEAERKKLKEMAVDLKIPEDIGYIIRTEALGKTKTELKKDLQSLVKQHKEILSKAKKAKGPQLIYQELDLVIRTIRDYFTAEIDEVLIDNPEVFDQAKAFFKVTMPKSEHLVKLHQEKRPIFSKYQLEEQIDLIYEKKVPLKSGGSLVIEPTEALVSIDVNSGKSTGEKGVEDTAFKTNIEAAEEAARQLRLRDLGGLIVIDFIDMRDKKHMAEVEKTLKNALKADKARVTVGKISQFGMLEMSRQRIKQTLEQASYLACPHCDGRGKVKSVENMALSFLRKVHAAAAKGTAAEVHGGLPLEVAYYLLNRKKRELAQIENNYDIEVTVKGKSSFLMNQLELEIIRRERPPGEEHEVAERPAKLDGEDAKAKTQEHPSMEEGKGKKKRKRKRKGRSESGGENASEQQALEPSSEPEIESPPAGDQEEEAVESGTSAHDDGHDEQPKKKRRRRRRRGKSHGGESHVGEVSEEVAEEQAATPETASSQEHHPDEETHPAEEPKKKRRRKRRRGKGHAADGQGAVAEEKAAEPVPPTLPEALPVEEKPAPKRPRRPAKAKPQPVSDVEEGAETLVKKTTKRKSAEPLVTGDDSPKAAPKKPRAPRRKKEPMEE